MSCTREGGPKLIRLIEGNLGRLGEFLLRGNSRVFYCGPKEIQDFLFRCVASVLQTSVGEISKRKLIVC